MFTSQGQKVLQLMIDRFRIRMVEEAPGVCENDIERAFLSDVLDTLGDTDQGFNKQCIDMIDGIR